MKMITTKPLNAILIIIFCTVSFVKFSGCSEDTIIPVVTYSNISVYHVDMNIASIDIAINDIGVATNVSYLDRLNYQQYLPGNINLKILNSTGPTIIDTVIFLSENNYYSVFIYDVGGVTKPLIVNDNLTNPGSLNSSVRFISFAPLAGSLSLGATGKSSAWFPNEDYGVPANFRPVTGGVYDLYMNEAFTPVTLATLTNETLAAQRIYTIIGKGISGGSGNQEIGIVVYNNQ